MTLAWNATIPARWATRGASVPPWAGAFVRGATGTLRAVGTVLRAASVTYVRAWGALCGAMALAAGLNALCLLIALAALRQATLALTPGPLLTALAMGGFALSQAITLLSMLAGLGMATAIVAGRQPGARERLVGNIRRGLTAVPSLLGALLLFVAAVTVLGGVTVLTAAGARVTLPLAAFAALAYVLRPQLRRRWLRWTILLLTPMAAPLYVSVRLALWPQTVIIERQAPFDALMRSAALTDGRWWLTALTLAVTSIVFGFVQPVGALVFGAIVAAATGHAPSLEAAVAAAGQVAPLAVIAFGAIPAVAGATLYARLVAGSVAGRAS